MLVTISWNGNIIMGYSSINIIHICSSHVLISFILQGKPLNFLFIWKNIKKIRQRKQRKMYEQKCTAVYSVQQYIIDVEIMFICTCLIYQHWIKSEDPFLRCLFWVMNHELLSKSSKYIYIAPLRTKFTQCFDRQNMRVHRQGSAMIKGT